MEFNEALLIAKQWEDEKACSGSALVARALYRHIAAFSRALLATPPTSKTDTQKCTDGGNCGVGGYCAGCKASHGELQRLREIGEKWMSQEGRDELDDWIDATTIKAEPTERDVFSIADAHAIESGEDGSRTFDRGGLLAFAADLPLNANPAALGGLNATKQPTEATCAAGAECDRLNAMCDLHYKNGFDAGRLANEMGDESALESVEKRGLEALRLLKELRVAQPLNTAAVQQLREIGEKWMSQEGCNELDDWIDATSLIATAPLIFHVIDDSGIDDCVEGSFATVEEAEQYRLEIAEDRKNERFSITKTGQGYTHAPATWSELQRRIQHDSVKAYSCHIRASMPNNENATCVEWCGNESTCDAVFSDATPAVEADAPVSFSGEVIEVGDDEHGQPRILIYGSREQVRGAVMLIGHGVVNFYSDVPAVEEDARFTYCSTKYLSDVQRDAARYRILRVCAPTWNDNHRANFLYAKFNEELDTALDWLIAAQSKGPK